MSVLQDWRDRNAFPLAGRRRSQNGQVLRMHPGALVAVHRFHSGGEASLKSFPPVECRHAQTQTQMQMQIAPHGEEIGWWPPPINARNRNFALPNGFEGRSQQPSACWHVRANFGLPTKRVTNCGATIVCHSTVRSMTWATILVII